MFDLPARQPGAIILAVAVLVACSGDRRNETSVVQEAGERGLKAIEQAQALQEGSRWQPPSEQASREAITRFEVGKTEIHELAIVSRSKPDERGTATVVTRINGETRRYLLRRGDDGQWAVAPSPLDF